MTEKKPRAFYYLTNADHRRPEVLKLLENYSLIVCAQSVKPSIIRQHTDAILLASLGATTIPRWGVGADIWDHYRDLFDDDDFFMEPDGTRSTDAKNRFWYLRPNIGSMLKIINWVRDQLDEFAGPYLDMSGRGGMWWLRSGLKMPEDYWGWYQDAQSAALDFLLKHFRRTLPNKLLLTNTWGPSRIQRAKDPFQVRYPLYNTEMMEQVNGVSLEDPGIEDLPYFQEVEKHCMKPCLSVSWFKEFQDEETVMPGDHRKDVVE